MKEDTEFQQIGKKIPYQVPDGFFDHISETTLLKAKQRSRNHRKIVTMWSVAAVAASLVGFALLGYYQFAPEKSGTPVATVEKQELMQPQAQEIQKPMVAETKTEETKPQSKVSDKSEAKKKTVDKINKTETFSDLLANLPDDDLLLMAAMIKTDPFTELASQ